MKKIEKFKPLLDLIKEYKNKLIFVSILIFISEMIGILTGYLIGEATEYIVNNALKIAIIYLVVYLALQLAVWASLKTIAKAKLLKIESVITRKLCFETYKKALELPSYAYEETSSGEIINRITHDADSLSFVFGSLLQVFSSIVGALILIVYIFFKSWILGLEILFFLVLLYLIIKKYNPLMKSAHKDRKKEQDKFTSLTNESIRGIREIKTLGIRNSLTSNMKDIMHRLVDKSNVEINYQKRFDILMRSLRSIMEVSVFITCIVLLYYKITSLSFFIAMTYYVYRFTYLIEELNSFVESYQRIVVSIERVNELLQNTLYKDEKYGNVSLSEVKGIIEFKDVTFGYPNDEILLKDFNLKLLPNKKIAIVGKSGQGKSTLFNLITRIFEYESGEILLDGVNINELDYPSIRKNISIIRQEPFIFNRTIRENFEIVDPEITLEEIRKYATKAYLDQYIMSLPNQYDTLLGEGGVNLSGGQKQRLAIARTLAKKSKVILFDEATSALDNASQNYIKNAIDDLVKDHTVVIVAHRLSTIIDADIIHVVGNGKIISSGTHEELLKNCESYRNLYEIESLNS